MIKLASIEVSRKVNRIRGKSGWRDSSMVKNTYDLQYWNGVSTLDRSLPPVSSAPEDLTAGRSGYLHSCAHTHVCKYIIQKQTRGKLVIIEDRFRSIYPVIEI